MLHLRKRKIRNVQQLIAALHGAVRLELATLPPYLTALYSIKHDENGPAALILRSVALEEMLHLCIACNILNAVGGHPAINSPGFPPRYPGKLPMGIGTTPGNPFIVPIKKASIELIRDVFMVIEEPEDPMHFYLSLEEAIRRFGNAIFTGDRTLQVTGWFPSGELFAVTDVDSAARAINIIIEQGEGTKTSPTDPEGRYAHYYRFAELVKGRRLVPNANAPQGYSYTGVPLPFNPDGVWPMVDNPSRVRLPKDSLVARYADEFDESYTTLLNAIQATVSGDPNQLDVAIGVMYQLRVQALLLMRTPIQDGVNAGPRWRFLP
jgi:Ferritin-like